MIKVIIFDLDGVLVDTKNIHFYALNFSLKRNNLKEITYEDHIKIFDGLPTSEKLKLISKKKKLSKKKIIKIKKDKNKITNELIKDKIIYDEKIKRIFSHFSKNYKIAIATNAIKETLDLCLKKLRIKRYVNFTISNKDLNQSKPNPEIYFRVFIKFGIYPNESLILEDSSYGRQAALSSGGNLMPIKNIEDVSINNIINYLKLHSKKSVINKNNEWEDNRLNVLVPMAGAGKRFVDAGYTFPKPLIEINNKPMIQWVVDCLNINANYIFLILKEHQMKYNISSVLKILKPR